MEGEPNPTYLPPDVDPSRARWFAEQLVALEEEALWPPSPGAEIYRFTWLRSFDHPTTVRLEISGTTARIVAKAGSGAGGYDPGTVVDRRERRLDLAEARTLAGRLELSGESPSWFLVLDGAEWILEAVKGGEYTVRVMCSPEDRPFRYGCLKLLRASRLRVRGDVY
ncbi:MAG TPA: hypothetical protein VFN91_02640 [Myxococcaceae bacterium]|nr:hypothetical protein [Myxococcaceae bacterium]